MPTTMGQSDHYKTLTVPSKGSYSELRSRFLAYAHPIISEEDAIRIVKTLKNKYHDARHIAYAYQIGAEGERWRANDDGEPSGTAGKPILGVLRSFDITNSLIAVVRYYGGTPLGAKNLGRAYAQAAAEALNEAKLQTVLLTERISLSTQYAHTDQILRIARQVEAQTKLEYQPSEVIVHIDVARSKAQQLRKTLENSRKVLMFKN